MGHSSYMNQNVTVNVWLTKYQQSQYLQIQFCSPLFQRLTIETLFKKKKKKKEFQRLVNARRFDVEPSEAIVKINPCLGILILGETSLSSTDEQLAGSPESKAHETCVQWPSPSQNSGLREQPAPFPSTHNTGPGHTDHSLMSISCQPSHSTSVSPSGASCF